MYPGRLAIAIITITVIAVVITLVAIPEGPESGSLPAHSPAEEAGKETTGASQSVAADVILESLFVSSVVLPQTPSLTSVTYTGRRGRQLQPHQYPGSQI